MIFDKLTMKIINNEKKLKDLTNRESVDFAIDLIHEYCINPGKYLSQIIKSYATTIFLMGIIIFSWWNVYSNYIEIDMRYDLLVAIDHILLVLCSIYALYYLVSSGKISLLIADVYESINQLGKLTVIHREITNITKNNKIESASEAIGKVIDISEMKAAYLIADHLSYASEYTSFDKVRNVMNKIFVSYIALTVFLIYI